jgi:hypothetical protein
MVEDLRQSVTRCEYVRRYVACKYYSGEIQWFCGTICFKNSHSRIFCVKSSQMAENCLIIV